jgi:hypothetical protein
VVRNAELGRCVAVGRVVHGLTVVLLGSHHGLLELLRERLLVLQAVLGLVHVLDLLRLVWVTDLELGAALLVVASSSVHASVPPVLHGVVTASSQASGDLCPSLAHLCHHLFDQDALLGSDGVMVEVWLQVLVEAFSTLLRRASLNCGGDADPVVSTVNGDEVEEELVLLLRPRTTLVLRHVGDVVCWRCSICSTVFLSWTMNR